MSDEPGPAAPGPDGPDGPDQGDAPVVTRPPRSTGSGSRNVRIAAVAGVCLLAIVGVLLLLRGGDDEPVASRSTSTTTTTEAPTTAAPAPAGAVAPLTGVRLPDEEAGRLARPAVAVKVDNAPEAAPQFGVSAADLVLEPRVEGISRFIVVFHSNDVGTAGPVRSARTTDPDLLAMFGRPLVAWSGGNPTVVRIMRDTPWIQNLQYDVLPSAYRRERSRPAPHNLLVDVPQLWAAADEPVVPPTPLFAYRADGEAPAGRPVAGVTVPVGSTSTYVWDAGQGRWLRWSGGKRSTDDGGNQLGPANVVVLSTPYRPSSADARSPEAQTIGSGRAWVYTGGHEVTGTWFRGERTAPWLLVDDAGQPIELTPGQTWVALPDDASAPAEVDAATAQGLLAG